MLAQCESFFDDLIDIDRPALRLVVPDGSQDLLHDVSGPVRLRENHLQPLSGYIAEVIILLHREFRKTDDRRKRVIKLVSNARKQHADGGHLLRSIELSLEIEPLSYVLYQNHRAGRAIGGVDRTCSNEDIESSLILRNQFGLAGNLVLRERIAEGILQSLDFSFKEQRPHFFADQILSSGTYHGFQTLVHSSHPE